MSEEDQNKQYFALRDFWQNAVLSERRPQVFLLKN